MGRRPARPRAIPADLPPPIEWPNEQKWQLEDLIGPPDHVIKSKPFDVPSEGGDTWWRPRVPTGLDEDRWVMAFETRPSFPAGRQVVHHAIPRLLRLNEEGEYQRIQSLSEYAMGKVGEIVPRRRGAAAQGERHDRVGRALLSHGIRRAPAIRSNSGSGSTRRATSRSSSRICASITLRGDIALAPGGTAMTQGFQRWDHPVRHRQLPAARTRAPARDVDPGPLPRRSDLSSCKHGHRLRRPLASQLHLRG